MSEPSTIGREAAALLAALLAEQLVEEVRGLEDRIICNAMVALCLEARAEHPAVAYVVLDDSDQGPWMVVAGLSSVLPEQPGDFAWGGDLDPDDLFDDCGWASALTDRSAGSWEPYCRTSESMSRWRFLDVDAVLTTVSVPWREAGL